MRKTKGRMRGNLIAGLSDAFDGNDDSGKKSIGGRRTVRKYRESDVCFI